MRFPHSRNYIHINQVGSFVLGVEYNSLVIGHMDHRMVKSGKGQPDSGRELIFEQGEL